MFRILYFVVAIVAVLWILPSRPIWLDPTQVVEVPIAEAAGDADEVVDGNETARRAWIALVAVFGVIVASEVWCFLVGRMKLFHRI